MAILKAHNSFLKANGKILVKPEGGGDSVVIGGRKYPFVQIGRQLWIVYNLDYADENITVGGGLSTSIPKAYYYDQDEAINGWNGRKINLLYNVPSIGLWTIFNEGWGQFDAKEIYNKLVKIDSTRIYDHASGWHDQGVSDTKSLHVYFKAVKMPKEKQIKNRSVILSECGGYQLRVEGHTFNDTNFGYKKMRSSKELEDAYEAFINRDVINNIPKGLSAFIYTQLSDVEDELNGFITYDREVVKVDKDRIKEINDKVTL